MIALLVACGVGFILKLGGKFERWHNKRVDEKDSLDNVDDADDPSWDAYYAAKEKLDRLIEEEKKLPRTLLT